MYIPLKPLPELLLDIKNNPEKDFFSAQNWSMISSETIDNSDNVSHI